MHQIAAPQWDWHGRALFRVHNSAAAVHDHRDHARCQCRGPDRLRSAPRPPRRAHAGAAPADREEVEALSGRNPREVLIESVEPAASEAWAGLADGKLVCLFGVVPMSLIGVTGIPWLLGSDDVCAYSRPFLRRNRAYLHECCGNTRCCATWSTPATTSRSAGCAGWASRSASRADGRKGLPFIPFEMESPECVSRSPSTALAALALGPRRARPCRRHGPDEPAGRDGRAAELISRSRPASASRSPTGRPRTRFSAAGGRAEAARPHGQREGTQTAALAAQGTDLWRQPDRHPGRHRAAGEQDALTDPQQRGARGVGLSGAGRGLRCRCHAARQLPAVLPRRRLLAADGRELAGDKWDMFRRSDPSGGAGAYQESYSGPGAFVT
jgi:hypothetical protein